MDFLLLLAAQMDANRNYSHYTAVGNTKIAEALGCEDWRAKWKASNLARDRFPVFLAEEFSQSMSALGYLPRKAHDMKLVKTYENNMALYYLALFSKHPTAYDFWPMEESWVISLQKQCKAVGVPFFFKQWGGVHKKMHGRTLRGRTHDGFPKRITNPTLPALIRMERARDIERSALIQIVTA